MERGRDPIRGPIGDVANVLAKLFEEGYQYRSLNAYRSAISSVHEKVDSEVMGQHPLISRLLMKDLQDLNTIQSGMWIWSLTCLGGMDLPVTFPLKTLQSKRLCSLL